MNCPVCGGDTAKDISATKAIIQKIGILSEYCDPGGRELVIQGIGKVRLTDMCNACDERVLLENIGKWKLATGQN